MTLDVGERRILHPGPLRWLRALGWMVLLFVLVACAQYGSGLLSHDLFGSAKGWPGLGMAVFTCLVIPTCYVMLVRSGEDRRAVELDLKPALIELPAGLAIGAVMFAGVMSVLALGGLYTISGPRAASAVNSAAMAIESGVLEELMLRAIVFRLLMRAFGPWWALGLSAALFGVLHVMNPNATPTAAFAIAIEAGLMLAAFYLLTGRVWVSIGVHAAWNFTQAFVFGATVSGFASKESVLVSTPVAGRPEMLTGGAFGPEASIPAMLVGTGVAAVTLWLAWKRGAFAKSA